MMTKRNTKTTKLFLMFALLGMIIPCVFGFNTKNVNAAERKASVTSNVAITPVVTKTEPDNAGNTTTTETQNLNDFDVHLDENGNLVTSFDNQGDSQSTWKKLFEKYKGVILGIFGLLTLTFIIWFGVCFARIAANASNPQGRREAITGCIFTAIAAAGCGSITVITALAWNAFR